MCFYFCEQKFIQPGPITIAIDCSGLSLLIFEEKWFNYASGPKSIPNSDSFWVRLLLKPSVAYILLFNFCEEKFIQHGPLTISIDCNDLSLLIFEEKWPNYASGPKSAPNRDSFWVRRLFNVCMWVFCVPNGKILLGYLPTEIKMSFM